MQTDSENRLYEVIYQYGLHLQPAALFVKVANCFQELEIRIRKQDEDDYINGKSIMNMIMLAATKGSILDIKCIGPEKMRHDFYNRIENLEEKIFKRYLVKIA
jgi:phosphocarrier protein